jgi:hypothetical protein
VKYTIPTTAELFAQTSGAKLFLELDLTTAFHQIPVEKESQKLLGFTAPNGKQFVWMKMLFGLKGAPTHFQQILTIFWFIQQQLKNILSISI